MARIVRPMKFDPAEPTRPLVGHQSKCLGVRVSGEHADVTLDRDGFVVQDAAGREGMSVTRCWKTLIQMDQLHLVPIEMDDGFNGARGKGMKVFVHGSGPFEEGEVTSSLALWFKNGQTEAGVVAPTTTVHIDQFQLDLAATRSDWVVDESEAP